MIITLVDAKRFSTIEGKEFNRQLMSFNTHTKRWTNGWCPCSVLKLLPNGKIIARISNELVPAGVYDGIEIKVNEWDRFYKSVTWWLNKLQERAEDSRYSAKALDTQIAENMILTGRP